MITLYLLEYTIAVTFGSNVSECARYLGMEYDELRRFRKRLMKGDGSLRVIEELLIMYAREHIKLDPALEQYNDSWRDWLPVGETVVCDGHLLEIRAGILARGREHQDNAKLLKAAAAFITQLERTLCGRACSARRDCAADCPGLKFMELVDWIKDELEIIRKTRIGDQ